MPSSKKLHITIPAQQDLQHIARYTQQTWGTKQKLKYISQLKSGFDDICKHATIGKHYHAIDHSLRAHPCQKHIIFYRIASHEISVIRVLHQSMDIKAQFSE